MNIFEYASKQKLRFSSIKGSLTVEDLWDLPLVHSKNANLDAVARTCNDALKGLGDESFVHMPGTTTKRGQKVAQAKLDIVKRIIEVKIEELEANKAAVENRAQKKRILEIIASKQDEALSNKSIDELTQMVSGL